ncbi:MAG: hypothetical protein AAGI15_12045 [Pseudomonadota bacterium]
MSRTVRSAFSLAVLALAASLPTAPAFASGTLSTQGDAQRRVIDERYEYGKSVYLGREPGTTRYDYCLQQDGAAEKLKRRTLKPFRGGKAGDFARALVRCDAPEQQVLAALQPEQVRFVLYYLNKRYKLNLQ